MLNDAEPLSGRENASSMSRQSASRMPAERHVAPDPRADREGFIVRLGQLLDATRYDLLLPGTDASLLVISRHRDRLPAWAARGLA